MFHVALYARVSTPDQQTIPLQMRAMREYAAARGWTIIETPDEYDVDFTATHCFDQLPSQFAL